MSFYRKILKQAWKITWQNKYLWLFGIFAAMLGNGGEYEILYRSVGSGGGQETIPIWQRLAETGLFSKKIFSNVNQIMAEDSLSLLLILFVGLAILALLVFGIWLVIVSQVALVNNSAGIIEGKRTNWQNGFNSGIKKFWPVLGLNIILKAIIYLILIFLSLPIILSAKTVTLTANFLFIIAFIVFIPIILSLSFILKYAIAYVVIRNSDFIESIKQGWQLFINNWLVSLEMAFILFFINLLVGLAIILLILILAIPFLFLGFIFYYLASLFGFWTIFILALIILFLVIILGGAALAVFQISSWIGLFTELIKHGGKSKLVRVMENIYNKT